VKRTNALWLTIFACFFAASCEPLFERGSGIFATRDLEGHWYVNGDRDKRAEIVPLGREGYEVRNERGQKSRLEISRGGDVRALDWEGGLRGNVRRDRIEWANGSTWMREPRGR
jgi:hypothetical protein